MSDKITLRPEVKKFAELMEVQLRRNDHKSGWKKCKRETLFLRATEEFGEFAGALERQETRHEIMSEGADVANFLMMILDVTNCLGDDELSDFISHWTDEDVDIEGTNIEINLTECNNPFTLKLITEGEVIERKFQQFEFVETINSAISSAEDEDNA